MVRNVKGFTFVELMISMIILSIVLTIVTGTMVYISRRNSSTDEKNHGYQIAKEKLIELQGSSEIVKNVGSDTPERNGLEYDRSWVINTTELPYPVTVTVYWTSNGIKDSAKVVGYVNSGVCPTITGNQAPKVPQLFALDGTEITASPIPIGKNGNIFICSLFADDQNLAKGDIVEIDFDPSGTDNDLFKITTDNHLYSRTTATTPGTYNVKIVATDCEPTNITYKTIPVEIINEFTVEVSEGNASIAENSANGTEVGTAAADPGAESWKILSGDPTDIFAIDNDGLITVNDSTQLNFESETIANPMTLILEATYAGKTGTGKFHVTITDVKEAPYDITLDTDTIKIPITAGEIIIKLTGHDDDEGDSTKTLTFLKEYSPYDFGLLDPDASDGIAHFNGIAFKSSAVSSINKLTAGDSFIARISAMDMTNLSFEKEITFYIGSAAVDTCNKYTAWSSTQSYSAGTIVTYNGIIWKCDQWIGSGSDAPTGSAYWLMQSICGIVDASKYEDYSSTKKYDWTQKNVVVKYNGHLYLNIKAEDSNLGMISNTSYWTDMGAY